MQILHISIEQKSPVSLDFDERKRGISSRKGQCLVIIGRWFNSPNLHVIVSLGKLLNPPSRH